MTSGHRDLAHVGPVDLGDLPGERFDVEVGPAGPWPHLAHVAAEAAQAPGVAARPDHVEQPRGDQTRILLERLIDERHVRIQQRAGWFCRPRLGAEASQDPLDDVEVNAELGGNGPAPPVLGEVQPPDLGGDLETDRHGSTSARSSWRRSPPSTKKQSQPLRRAPAPRAQPQPRRLRRASPGPRRGRPTRSVRSRGTPGIIGAIDAAFGSAVPCDRAARVSRLAWSGSRCPARGANLPLRLCSHEVLVGGASWWLAVAERRHTHSPSTSFTRGPMAVMVLITI